MSAMAKAQKAKAEEYLAEAQKTLSKRSWFGSGKERNQEDAAELILQAANAYKVGGLQQEAGDAYSRAGGIYRDELKNPNEAAKCFSNAGESHFRSVVKGLGSRVMPRPTFSLASRLNNTSFLLLPLPLCHRTGSCYKKASAADAIASFQSAVSLLTDAGRLTQAAKLCKECAELYENDEVAADGDKSAVVCAIEWYEQAAELFTLEDSKSQASQCHVKIAELCSAALEPPDLLRAAGLYDQLGRNCLESNLLKYNAKSYFLQAVLCHLANSDCVAAQECLSNYEGLDYTFGESREGKFAAQLVQCTEGMDAAGLATACFEYDRISKLDPWKTSMLVRVKRSIQGEGGNGDEEDFDLT